MNTLKLSQLWVPRRLWIILFLGFSSGLPIALTASTLGAWYTQAGINILGIGLLSLIGQPYIYKFLWAPLMDRFDPLGLGCRRSWMLITQVLIIICLVLMAQLNPIQDPVMLPMLALLMAIFSASQDIAISAYLTTAPREVERGLASSFYMSGYRVALIVASTFALIIAQYFGWKIAYLSMASLMIIGMISAWFTPHLEVPLHSHSLKDILLVPFLEFWRRFGLRKLLIIFAVLITYKLTDALGLALNNVLLLRDLHFSLAEVGSINKAFGFAATILGSIAGGVLMRWCSLTLIRALFIFGVLQALGNISFIWLYLSGTNLPVFACTVLIDNFFNGMGTTAFLALTLSLCHSQFAGTQFALLSAVTSIGRVYIGPIAALLVAHFGWVWYYTLTIFVGLSALFLLVPLKKALHLH